MKQTLLLKVSITKLPRCQWTLLLFPLGLSRSTWNSPAADISQMLPGSDVVSSCANAAEAGKTSQAVVAASFLFLPLYSFIAVPFPTKSNVFL